MGAVVGLGRSGVACVVLGLGWGGWQVVLGWAWVGSQLGAVQAGAGQRWSWDPSGRGWGCCRGAAGAGLGRAGLEWEPLWLGGAGWSRVAGSGLSWRGLLSPGWAGVRAAGAGAGARAGVGTAGRGRPCRAGPGWGYWGWTWAVLGWRAAAAAGLEVARLGWAQRCWSMGHCSWGGLGWSVVAGRTGLVLVRLELGPLGMGWEGRDWSGSHCGLRGRVVLGSLGLELSWSGAAEVWLDWIWGPLSSGWGCAGVWAIGVGPGCTGVAGYAGLGLGGRGVWVGAGLQ
jgi:hypothetical protein